MAEPWERWDRGWQGRAARGLQPSGGKQERLFVITLLSAGAGRVRDQMLFPESSKGNDGVMVDDGASQLYSCVLGA